jgi:chaperone modulatory protein CbpM
MAEHDEGVWLHGGTQVTLVELAHASGLGEDVLRELVEFGALVPVTVAVEASEWSFSADCVVRVRTAARLRTDLELETPALALVLTYLERVQRLETELRHLRAQLTAPRR